MRKLSSTIMRALSVALILAILGGCTAIRPPSSEETEKRVLTALAQPSAESPATETPQATASPLAPTATLTPHPTPTPAATATPEPTRLTVSIKTLQGVPDAANQLLADLLTKAGAEVVRAGGQGDLELDPADTGDAPLAWERILVPVDRLSSVLEGVTLQELRDVWSGVGSSDNFAAIYPSEVIMADLSALLGEPGSAVHPQPADKVADAVWGDPMGLGILPFDALTVRLRALKLDGLSATDNRFKPAEWPLASRAWLVATTEQGRVAAEQLSAALPITNRDADKLTVLVMTGVTAMARNSAAAIEQSGDYGFLARLVGPELAAADLTIISNEIPFVTGCVADNTLNNLLLCSKPEYWLNLELSGVDAVGLSGNHQNDFGYDNMRASLAFYAEKKIPVYGGGVDDKAAQVPVILEHNGNRLGFLAANQYGPLAYWNGNGEEVSAWAGPDHPGSARFDLAQMVGAIQALQPQVNLVFAEVQHTEFNDAGDYQIEPIPSQENDFRSLSDAGAAVVTGVMAHAPQAVEVRNGRLILYGLGNLYFDQTWSWPTRTGLVARHTIYDGHLINTELLVTVIETNFQLRWATPEERITVLRSIFDVSRWDVQ